MDTNKRRALFFAVMALILSIGMFLMPSSFVFANHQCTGNGFDDNEIDLTEGHQCGSASNNGGGSITTFSGLLDRISSIVNDIIPFIIGLAVFVIIWGIFNYLVHATEEEKRTEAKKYMLWGIIALFFMLSIWGFVNILLNTFNLKRTINASDIPRVPRIGGTPGDRDDDRGNPPPVNDVDDWW